MRQIGIEDIRKELKLVGDKATKAQLEDLQK
jgi:hypothetical protein